MKSNIFLIIKKCIFLLPILIFGYAATANFSIISEYQNYKNLSKEYVIEVSGGKNNESLGTEVRILDIQINNVSMDLEQYSVEAGDFQYVDGMLLGYDGSLTLQLQATDTVLIRFLKHRWSGIVNITDTEGNFSSQDLYSENDDVSEFLYEFDNSVIWNKYKTFNFENIEFFQKYIIISFGIYVLVLAIHKSFQKILIKSNWYFILIYSICLMILLISVLFSSLKIYGYILCIIFFLITVFIAGYTIINRSKELNKIFAIIYPFFAAFIILLLPPGHVPDEYAHFIKAYEASVIGDSHTALREGFEFEGEVYIYLPNAILNINNDYMLNVSQYDVSYNIDQYYLSLSERVYQDDISEDLFWFGNTASLNKTAYILDIIVCFILNLFHMPAIMYFLIIRSVHMIVTACIGSWLIKKVPIYKHIFFLIMLLPITVQQSIGINQDWLTNLVCFVCIAVIVYEIHVLDNIKFTTIILLIILSGILGGLKIGYFPCLLLVLLISKSKFKTHKIDLISKAAIILPCLSISIIQYFSAASSVQSNGELPYYSIEYIFLHPIETVIIYLRTLFQDGDYLLSRGLISGFGWYTQYGENFFIFIASVVSIGLLLSENKEVIRINRIKFKILTLLAFSIISILVFTSMFLGWTMVNYNTIQGLQPRYFIVPLLLLYLGMQNKKMVLISVKYELVYGAFSSVVLGYSLIAFLEYWRI